MHKIPFIVNQQEIVIYDNDLFSTFLSANQMPHSIHSRFGMLGSTALH